MSIALATVQGYNATPSPVIGTILQKIFNGVAYLYWPITDPNASTYQANLVTSRQFWSTYASFTSSFFVDVIEDTKGNICGYAVNYDMTANDMYATTNLRIISPFRFFTDSENFTWRFINGLWLVFYQFLVIGLNSTGKYIPKMDLTNIFVHDNVFYYGWLFDIDAVVNSAMGAPPIHPKYLELVTLYVNGQSDDINAIIVLIATDVYHGFSTDPYEYDGNGNEPSA